MMQSSYIDKKTFLDFNNVNILIKLLMDKNDHKVFNISFRF